MSWIEAPLDSGRRPDQDKSEIVDAALCVLDGRPLFSKEVGCIIYREGVTHLGVVMDFLALGHMENIRTAVSNRSLWDMVIVALQLIRVECSDPRSPAPISRILGSPLVYTLTWAADGNPLDTPQLRPLALEIFTLIGGTWSGPCTSTVSSKDKARLVEALGDVLDTPNLPPPSPT